MGRECRSTTFDSFPKLQLCLLLLGISTLCRPQGVPLISERNPRVIMPSHLSLHVVELGDWHLVRPSSNVKVSTCVPLRDQCLGRKPLIYVCGISIAFFNVIVAFHVHRCFYSYIVSRNRSSFGRNTSWLLFHACACPRVKI